MSDEIHFFIFLN